MKKAVADLHLVSSETHMHTGQMEREGRKAKISFSIFGAQNKRSP